MLEYCPVWIINWYVRHHYQYWNVRKLNNCENILISHVRKKQEHTSCAICDFCKCLQTVPSGKNYHKQQQYAKVKEKLPLSVSKHFVCVSTKKTTPSDISHYHVI